MKRLAAVLCLLLLLLPAAHAEELESSMADTLDALDLTALGEALADLGEPFSPESLRKTVLSIAKGETIVSFEHLMQLIGQRFLKALTGTLWRVTRLLIPALALGACETMTGGGRGGRVGTAICFLLTALMMVRDLADHVQTASETVLHMSEGMQGLFPILLTLLAAVGGSAGSAIFQPAVVAAAGAMTVLVRQVTLPLASAAALTQMLDHLGEEKRLSNLGALLYGCACWTLGICFTVFIGVILTQGMSAAAVDGVTIRTAKYALDNFVPVVGGLFADTVDTLVGGSLLIQNALGATGLLAILAMCLTPLCQTLAAAALYRVAAALMQLAAPSRVTGCLEAFGRVLMLLFIIQLCTAAMFVLLIAQIIAMSSVTVMLR